VRGFLWALLGVIVGGSLAGLMLHWKQVAESVPGIHDITTDTASPPEFVALLRLRKSDENSPAYGGAEVAVRQLKAYRTSSLLCFLSLRIKPSKGPLPWQGVWMADHRR